MPTVRIETITPAKAEKYLKRNTRNRRPKTKSVEQYAADMREGNFVLSGASIVFDEDNVLLDGQNRLMACVEAGASFQSLVLVGVPPAVQSVIDRGAKRSLADTLRLNGETDVNRLAATIAHAWRWENGELLSNQPPTMAQALVWLEAHPTVRDALHLAEPLVRRPLNARSASSGPFVFAIQNIDVDHAARFIDDVRQGVSFDNTDPAFRLREWLLNHQGKLRVDIVSEMAVFIKAWNAYVTGKSLSPRGGLRWQRSGQGREKFPVLLDLDGLPVAGDVTQD